MKSLYVMKSNGAYKIGVSQDPGKRLKNLGIANCDIELIYASKLMCNAYAVEHALHKKFKNCAVGREWFHISDENKLLEEVSTLVEKVGIFNQRQKFDPAAKQSADSAEALIGWLFKPEQEQLEQLCKEIEEINKENDFLAKCLIEVGWTQEEIDSLVEKAIESV